MRLPSTLLSDQWLSPSPVAVSISRPSGISTRNRKTPERVIVTAIEEVTNKRSSPSDTNCHDSARNSGDSAATFTFACA